MILLTGNRKTTNYKHTYKEHVKNVNTVMHCHTKRIVTEQLIGQFTLGNWFSHVQNFCPH